MTRHLRHVPIRVHGLICLAGVLFLLATTAHADDVVILVDGFSIRGKHFKEKISTDTEKWTKLVGFDGVDSGPRYSFFSSHSVKQLAGIEKDVAPLSKLSFETKVYANPSAFRLPGVGGMKTSSFDEKWRRTIDVRFQDGKFDTIRQQISFISPSRLYIISTSHVWRQGYATREFDPATIRKLLLDHPTLREVPGKVDPKKRMLLAEFMAEVGWLGSAREELARLKKDAPGEWDKDASDKYEQLQRSLDEQEAKAVVEELELAVVGGRYQTAERYLAGYTPKAAVARDLTRLTELKVDVETITGKYRLARDLLRELIDVQTGRAPANAFFGLAGGLAVKPIVAKVPTGKFVSLIAAAEAVLTELHPDTVGRLDLFIGQAEQAGKPRLPGQPPAETPAELFALAITGWLQGKNGASKDADLAIRLWNSRRFTVDYMKEQGQNQRSILLKSYLASNDKLSTEELSQVVALLPPVLPENLAALRSNPIDPRVAAGVAGMYRQTTGSSPEDGGGLKYVLRLPPEYHHGRSYPVIIALNTPGFETEKMVAGLAADADRNGYIVAALEWDRGKAYDYNGREHGAIQAILRDLSRRFSIESDRVFLFGYAEGANLALDMGISHSDMFAGVIAMSPSIVWPFYQEYWRNAQKLPVYSVVGELTGFDSLRKLYEKWLPLGYAGVLTVYKGRTTEWFANELPTIFDWMGRKTRVRGNASLKLNATRFDPWQSMRDSDKRFYWVEFSDIYPANTMRTDKPNAPPFPATIRADIRKGNEIVLEDVRGVRKLTVWLERDMIDWTRDVNVKVPFSRTPWKPRKMTPDPAVMFEHLYQTADRKMLFFGKLEFELGS